MLNLLKTELANLNFSVETARSAAEARTKIQSFDPDIVLLDISLGDGLNGLQLGQILSRSRPDIAQVYLTQYASVESATADGVELPLGAILIRKHAIADTEELVRIIDEVTASKQRIKTPPVPDQAFPQLSEKTLQVLILLAEGHSNQSIAQELNLSVKSIERYVDSLYTSLKIDASAESNPRVHAALLYHRTLGSHELPTA